MDLQISKDLALPLRAVTEKIAWLGRTGSGKTYGALKLAELMLDAKAQIGAIDPVGVWRALRVPAAKGGTSYEVVVFGGLYGDLPLEPTAGTLIADLVVDRGISFVLDVSQFIPSEQQRFVHAFADRFFHRKKSSSSAVHLFMEECQEFIPENPSGLEAQTLGVMQRLWKLGRNFGIGGSLISQRPQEIAKKALNMSGTLFAFQMSAPQERKAVKAWIADHDIALDIEKVLRTLKTGEPHVEMIIETPDRIVHRHSGVVRILPRVTADLSSTPDVGNARATSRPLTPIDIERLKATMAETIERQKAEDPRELRKTIADLRQQLKASEKGKPAPAPKAPKIVEKPILKDAQVKRLEAAAGRIDRAMEQLGKWAQLFTGTEREVRNVGAEIKAAVAAAQATRPAGTDVGQASSATRAPVVVGAGRPVVASRPAPVVPVRVAREGRAPGGLGLAHARLLKTLDANPAGLTREDLGVRAGYRSDTGHFGNLLSDLRTSGLIGDVARGLIGLTEGGVAAARADVGIYAYAPAQLVEAWKKKFGTAETKTLDALLHAWTQGGLTREEAGAAVGLRADTGHFGNILSALRTNGLIETNRDGRIVVHRALVEG